MPSDLRHAVHLLGRQRRFAAAAILTLALGVGANAAVFAVAWRVMFEPLPWPSADRLVQVWGTVQRTGATHVIAPANYLDFEREAQSFEALAAYYFFSHSLNLTGTGVPKQLQVRVVTGDYFRVFGTPARLGRTLLPDDVRGDGLAAVISEGLWRRQFAEDPAIVGRRIHLDDRPYEIVGVMPGTFDVGASPVDAWVPYVFTPQLQEMRLGYFLAAVGRLRDGVTVAQAREEVAAIARRAAERHPSSNAEIGATVRPIREELVGPFRTGLLMLGGAAALVLLIACANLTGLQLARGAARQRELAVRAALGATRGRLIRQLLTESFVVALAAGVVGLLAGLWTAEGILAAAPPTLIASSAVGLDAVVTATTLAIAVAAGVLFAWVPAWRATRPAPIEALRGRTASDRGTGRIRATLVIVQVALATMLLVSASVLVVSMINVLRVDPGFDPSDVIVADLRLPAPRYGNPDARSRFFDGVFERLQAAAGIEAVCATDAVPFEHEGRMTYVPDGTTTLVGALPLTVSPQCFRALRIRLLQGRTFDRTEVEPVAIVSESFARSAFGADDPIGRILRVGLPAGEPLTVVGVVADSRRVSLEAAPSAQVYHLAGQSTFFVATKVLVRASAPPGPVVAALEQAVRETDPAQPLANVRTMEAVLARSLAARRFNLILLGCFATMALVLSAIGVYGLLAQLVAQRRGEIGVRIALGAGSAAILRLVAGDALRAVLAGIPTGLVAAWSTARILARFTFEVSPTAPWIYLGAALVVTTAAALAAYLPARRATRIDPLAALRAD